MGHYRGHHFLQIFNFLNVSELSNFYLQIVIKHNAVKIQTDYIIKRRGKLLSMDNILGVQSEHSLCYLTQIV